MTEHQLQRAIAKFLSHALPRDAAWTAIDAATGAQLDGVRGFLRKSRGVKSGWPDIQIVWLGRYHGVEVKAGSGAQSECQRAVAERLHMAGAPYAVCRSVCQVHDTLRSWGIPIALTQWDMQAEQYDALLEVRAPPTAPGKKRNSQRASASVIARAHRMGVWKK